MRPYVVAGNWKMNSDIQSGKQLAEDIRDALLSNPLAANVKIVLCPPFTHLAAISEIVKDSDIGLGAQNMCFEDSGAFTGEISAAMIKSAGCDHVILGHSERRQYFNESDETINRKARKALAGGLTPIVCIGETLQQRESGIATEVVASQLDGVLQGIDAGDMARVILAYEPVWAIGTGRTATPDQAQEIHGFIRQRLVAMYDSSVASEIVIQYCGSMKAENAAELLSRPDVDGGLIGGASLKSDSFLAIAAAANNISSQG